MERLTVSRPPYLVWMNLAAAGLFLLAAIFYVLQAKWLFAIAWFAISTFWLRRFAWARTSPYIEIADGTITAHLSATRQRSIPLSEVEKVRDEESQIVVELNDGSVIPLSKAQITEGEVSYAATWIQEQAGSK